jgi:hypothetical protein
MARIIRTAFTFVALAALLTPAAAQGGPTRPVTMVVPFAADVAIWQRNGSREPVALLSELKEGAFMTSDTGASLQFLDLFSGLGDRGPLAPDASFIGAWDLDVGIDTLSARIGVLMGDWRRGGCGCTDREPANRRQTHPTDHRSQHDLVRVMSIDAGRSDGLCC